MKAVAMAECPVDILIYTKKIQRNLVKTCAVENGMGSAKAVWYLLHTGLEADTAT